MHKNVLAAEFAAEQDTFSSAEEYRRRLDVELELRMQEEIYNYMRKEGLVEEEDRKKKSPRLTLTDFDASKHTISTMASSQFSS